MNKDKARVLVLGAHPDDAEIFAGGLLCRHRAHGSQVKIISVSDGRCGHHQIPPEELVSIRRKEAERAGQCIGAQYLTWDFPDGGLTASLPVREAIIREIRSFHPDLVLTHRPYDYHPDHRAVGTAVQDASYLVTVPHTCPEVEALRADPVVAYMCDLFTRPNRLRADVLLEVSEEFDLTTKMVACHTSQVFEWLPYHDGQLDSVPESVDGRRQWLAHWLAHLHAMRVEHFREELLEHEISPEPSLRIEVYELSEYAFPPTSEQLGRLFPGRIT